MSKSNGYKSPTLSRVGRVGLYATKRVYGHLGRQQGRWRWDGIRYEGREGEMEMEMDKRGMINELERMMTEKAGWK